MRKHQFLLSESAHLSEQAWLDLDRIASVESLRKNRAIQLNLRWSEKLAKVGVRPVRELR
jgi:hypothetical protein